jgi:hypothetical protein
MNQPRRRVYERRALIVDGLVRCFVLSGPIRIIVSCSIAGGNGSASWLIVVTRFRPFGNHVADGIECDPEAPESTLMTLPDTLVATLVLMPTNITDSPEPSPCGGAVFSGRS